MVATLMGIVFSLFLTTGIFLLGDRIRGVFTEENIDVLEGFLMIFSGVFIAYVIFSLHDVLQKNRGALLMKAHQKLKTNVFDMSLFFTIMFLVLREGFEIALFTASTSLFSAFIQNFIGLIIGFVVAIFAGLVTLYAYVKFPIEKMFKATEYMIILLGAALTQRGVTELIERYLHIDLSHIFSFNLYFLPSEDTFVGHLLQGFLGIDRGLSLTRLIIMIVYIIVIYLLFLKEKKTHTTGVTV